VARSATSRGDAVPRKRGDCLGRVSRNGPSSGAQQQLLDAIREVAGGNEWNTAASWTVDERLGRKVRHDEYRSPAEAGHLSAVRQVAARPGGAALTVGLQSKDVPLFSNRPEAYQPNGRREPWPGDANAGFEFPLFGCPACGKPLRMRPGGGTDGHDRLACPACPWAFDGWAGSRSRVQRHPPDFFLPVAESLSQWLHDPSAGSLFGDRPEFLRPRAILADEIHLYSHIQGAQIGYALRRLFARCELNARPGDVRPPRPLAVGMSATFGEPSGGSRGGGGIEIGYRRGQNCRSTKRQNPPQPLRFQRVWISEGDGTRTRNHRIDSPVL
jgi:hypothetical protein